MGKDFDRYGRIISICQVVGQFALIVNDHYTTDDRLPISWIGYYRRMLSLPADPEFQWDGICRVRDCSRTDCVGGHVMDFAGNDRRQYIVPICRGHNTNRTPEEDPIAMELKPGSFLARINPIVSHFGNVLQMQRGTQIGTIDSILSASADGDIVDRWTPRSGTVELDQILYNMWGEEGGEP